MKEFLKNFKLPTVFLISPGLKIKFSQNKIYLSSIQEPISFSNFECICVFLKELFSEELFAPLLKKKFVFFISPMLKGNPKVLIPANKTYKFSEKELRELERSLGERFLYQEVFKSKLYLSSILGSQISGTSVRSNVFYQFMKNFYTSFCNLSYSQIESNFQMIDETLFNFFVQSFPEEWRSWKPLRAKIEALFTLLYRLSYAHLSALLVENQVNPFARTQNLKITLVKFLLEVVKPFLIKLVYELFFYGCVEKRDFSSNTINPQFLKVICKLYTEKILGDKLGVALNCWNEILDSI